MLIYCRSRFAPPIRGDDRACVDPTGTNNRTEAHIAVRERRDLVA
jgi:hypothetical protein